MTSIKKANSQVMDSKVLQELSEIKKTLQDAQRSVVAKSMVATQTTNSPYFPDRNYANPLAVKGNAEETAWKDVPTYDEQRNFDLETTPDQQSLVVINGKKLNII